MEDNKKDGEFAWFKIIDENGNIFYDPVHSQWWYDSLKKDYNEKIASGQQFPVWDVYKTCITD